ncbi:hypothetical protein T459_22239 [Capsicum annuum]|uniref:FF domain-containing protein n=1 Tax=Capsicum annuum TaxID=4072 RepID=A0A2G2YYX2_CAPAN|nr:hypothetical protein T459_22239 [Capsicum annuum]
MAILDPGDLFGSSSCITTTRLLERPNGECLMKSRSISVVKIASPGVDSSLVSAHGAKSRPIAVSPAANLPTIVASESASLSGKVSSPMIETVEIKNSSEPALPAVANSEKIGIANVKKDATITEIGGATPSDEKTVELGPLLYESKAEAKSAFKTLLESANIGFDCTKAISIFELDERFKAVKRAKDYEDLFEDYVEELVKKVKLLLQNFLEHAKALEEQKRNRVEYLEFLKSCDFIKASSQWRKVQDRSEIDERCSRLEKINRLEIFQEYIRDLESEEEEQRKLWMIKDFAAYLAVSSNTSGSTAKDLFTDVMDELEKQALAVSPAANLPTIGASESSSLSGKVSSPMIETVEIKNSSEPASPAVANSEKIGIAVTLGNSVAPSVSETTTIQDAVVYSDGFSLENRENVKKDAAITKIGGATPSDEKTVELGP